MIVKESPLRGIKYGSASTVSIREIPDLPAFDLRISPNTITQALVAEALGFELPTKIGHVARGSVFNGDEAYALCLAPDWWLIVGSREVEQKITSGISKSDHHFSLVDVSGQRTTIELEGPKASELLAHLWDQDLREKSFPVARVRQGLMAKALVIVWHIGQFHYRVMVRSSFALHLWKTLEDAMEEWD